MCYHYYQGPDSPLSNIRNLSDLSERLIGDNPFLHILDCSPKHGHYNIAAWQATTLDIIDRLHDSNVRRLDNTIT